MRELTVGKNIVANTPTVIYTVPKGCKAIATLLFISNSTGSNKTVNAVWHDSSEGDDIVILGTSNLDAKKYIQFSDGRLVMDEYDYVEVTTETGSTMSVILTVEIHQNTSYQNGS
jgi:hypothetical protein